MCSKKIVATRPAPRAIGPYSQAVISGDLLFTSGQLPINAAPALMVDGGTAKAAGAIFQHTKNTNVLLSDTNDLKVLNEIYQTYFTLPFPARSAFQVAALPLAGKFEVEAVNNTKTMS